MNDTPTPTAGGRPLLVYAVFVVNGDSQHEAMSVIERVLRPVLEGTASGVASEELRSRVTHWSLPEQHQFQAWDAFVDSGIPEIISEMFSPEPQRSAFVTDAGAFDEDAFGEAHDEWRSECLDLALHAAHLPELLTRLEHAESVRDEVAHVLARYPTPERPQRQDFPASIAESHFGARFDESAYARAFANWPTTLRRTVASRDAALERILNAHPARGRYLPPQFQREWIPRELLALSTLRALLEADPALTGRLLDRDTRQHLDAMLAAGDIDVRIIDPDDPDGPELYEGPASEAHRWVPPGVFEGTGIDGRGSFRVVVGASPVGDERTASAAFPPAEHDSAILSTISHLLDTAPEPAPAGQLLARVSALVAGSGRPGLAAEQTMLERGALLSDLLACRHGDLEPPASGEPPGRNDSGLSR